jgi:large subunit ribosomal protein L21
MKKAIIKSGGRQYLVTEGQEVDVNLLKGVKKSISFTPLLVLDDKKIKVGTPEVKNATVSATVVDSDKQAEKVTSIRYKAKKRVHTVRGHRQRISTLKITKISLT